MKIIFLDVDGVLNYASSEARTTSGAQGIASAPVKCLRQIVKDTGAFIVLTSTWKDEWNFNEEECSEDGKYLVRKLKREGLHILDKTHDMILNRGQGIQEWLEKHKGVDGWVVLDDEIYPDYEARGIMPHLVETSYGDRGLTSDLAQKAIAILNEGANYASK